MAISSTPTPSQTPPHYTHPHSPTHKRVYINVLSKLKPLYMSFIADVSHN